MESFLIENKKDENKIVEKKKTITNLYDSFFKPSEIYTDSLFWCWVVFNEGLSYYAFAESFNDNVKTEKIMALVPLLRESKKLFKTHKIKLGEVENNLIYDKFISLDSIKALALHFSYNFIYITDIFYYELNLFYDNKTLILYKKNDTYGVWIENNQPDLFKIKSTRITITNLNKPINNITSYKLQDIKDICSKLNINTLKDNSKSKTKKELYNLIIQNI